MCLAVPVKIVALEGDMAWVEADGVRRKVMVNLIKQPRVGETVLIHAGFAIQKWSDQEAEEFEVLKRETEEQGA